MTGSSALLAAALITLLGASVIGIAAALTSVARGTQTVPADGEYAAAAQPISGSTTALVGTVLAAILLLGSLVARTARTGHAPWSNLHEFSAAFAFGLLVVYIGLAMRRPIAGLTPAVALVAAALLGVSLLQPDEVRPLVPALQAPLLLTIHVGTAMLAYAIGAVAFAAALGEIVQRATHDGIASLPPTAVLRAAAHRAAILAFPILTAAIVLGSVWANLAWRSYWNNDPKELAAAATWLVYGGYLHVAGRRDRWAFSAPWLLVLGFVAILFTWLGAGLLFVGQHSYAGA
ncbi:MAG: cytochrome c biogenesis protein CcsA [Chloroflexi bacterium]|nr:cytochrome c biogenesis protein CcsA [Chloroflexota bacterium]